MMMSRNSKKNMIMFLNHFYKIDKSRNDSKSSVGLGMSIASDIVKSHGGNIALDKSPQNGLRVKVISPLVFFLNNFFLILDFFF